MATASCQWNGITDGRPLRVEDRQQRQRRPGRHKRAEHLRERCTAGVAASLLPTGIWEETPAVTVGPPSGAGGSAVRHASSARHAKAEPPAH